MAAPALEKENQDLKQALANLQERAELSHVVLSKLFDIELSLLACGSLADLLDLLLVRFSASFNLGQIHLVLFDPEYTVRQLLNSASVLDNGQLEFVSTQQPLREIHPDSKVRLLHADEQALQPYFPVPSSELRHVALLPLIRHDCLIGSLHLGCRDGSFSSLDPHLLAQYLRHLASVISICFENCISQENLQRLSNIDMLTKVLNRRAFEQELVKEVSRCSRTKQPLGCLFIDLDHFKQINDTHGHQTGDSVLRKVGLALKEHLRSTDIIARYGGEEFAVLLPGCDECCAEKMAQTLCQVVAELSFTADDTTELRITTSIGVASEAPRPSSKAINSLAHRLINAADRALYQAKRSGRNRYCLASRLD